MPIRYQLPVKNLTELLVQLRVQQTRRGGGGRCLALGGQLGFFPCLSPWPEPGIQRHMRRVPVLRVIGRLEGRALSTEPCRDGGGQRPARQTALTCLLRAAGRGAAVPDGTQSGRSTHITSRRAALESLPPSETTSQV